MTFITVRVKVSCLLRFTLAANSVVHTSDAVMAALYYVGVELENL